MHWGHDEAVFWVNLLSGNEWVIDGEVRDHQCQRHHANIVKYATAATKSKSVAYRADLAATMCLRRTQRRLRPKTPGRGLMVSAFVCESRGFGIPVTAAEWNAVKHIRDEVHAEHDWFDVPTPVAGHPVQIGLVMFAYGCKKVKEDSTNDDSLTSGWWNNAKMAYVRTCIVRHVVVGDGTIVQSLIHSAGRLLS